MYRKTTIVRQDVRVITPEQAEKMLEKNEQNRKIIKNRAYTYARAMKAGEWRLTGEPIIISTKGMLIDGQHRLMAVTIANTPIEFAVTIIRAVDGRQEELTALNMPLDIGAKRSVASITGIKATDVSTINVLIRLFEDGTKITPTPAETARKFELMEMYFEMFPKRSAGNVSSVAVRSAFIMAQASGLEVREIYDIVTQSKYERFTPLLASWKRWIERYPRVGGDTPNKEMFASVWQLLHKPLTIKMFVLGNVEKSIDEAYEVWWASTWEDKDV